MINAHDFPGPAMWQGLMMISLLWYFPCAFARGGRYFRLATIAYVLEGVALFVAIQLFLH